MKKIVLLLLPATLFLFSCDFIGGERVRGNGNVITQDRSVGNFAGVHSHGFFDVYVSYGATQSVKIEAEDNLQQYIETSIDGSTLRITTRDGYSLRPKRDVNVYITSPNYDMVRLSGSGDIVSQNQIRDDGKMELGISGSGDIKVDVNAPEVTAEISGSGTIELKGETRRFAGSVNGSGDIKAMDFKSEETSVEINGSGNAHVFASSKLNVDVRGSGDVRYKGGGQVHSDIKGSGSVVKVD